MNIIYDETEIMKISATIEDVKKWPNPPTKLDGLIKWASIIQAIIELDKAKDHISRLRSVLDIGSGNSALPLMLADLGFAVKCVDANNIHQQIQTHRSIEWCIEDAFRYIESLSDNSLDYAVDSCAVIHFDPSGDFLGPLPMNNGVARISKLLNKKLRIGGKFIMVTDFAYSARDNKNQPFICGAGEFLCDSYLLQTVYEGGLKLVGEVPEFPQEPFLQDYSQNGNHYKLGIMRYIFERTE